MSIAAHVLSTEPYKESIEIKTSKDIERDLQYYGALLEIETSNDFEIPETPPVIRAYYDILRKKNKTKLDNELLSLLGRDLRFDSTNELLVEKEDTVFRSGLLKLKKMNHPNIIVFKNSYIILNKKQRKALYKSLPTCNCCQKMMTKSEGKYGVFYYCSNNCEIQKTISQKYWQTVKRDLNKDKKRKKLKEDFEYNGY